MRERKDNYENWNADEAARLGAIADGKCVHDSDKKFELITMGAPNIEVFCVGCREVVNTYPVVG